MNRKGKNMTLFNNLTGKRKLNFEAELTKIAGAPVEVEVMDDLTSDFYMFCSDELGMWRLKDHYKGTNPDHGKHVDGRWFVTTNKDKS
jgi:hypothetical protein